MSNKKPCEYRIEHSEWMLREIINLQQGYKSLFDKKKLTKKAICDLVIPFRDKYGLKDLEALKIARNELSLAEIEAFISLHRCLPVKEET